MRVGRKQHPVSTEGMGVSDKVPYGCACFIRRRCLHGEGISGSTLAWVLASSLAGAAHFLAGCAPAACMRSPTKGTSQFMRACFMVFPLSTLLVRHMPACSMGPLSSGIAERNSPLKMLSRPWPCWYLMPAYGVMAATMVLSMLLWRRWRWWWCQLLLAFRSESSHLFAWTAAWLSMSCLQIGPFGPDHQL